MEPEGQLRNLRDFLLVYNRMTEICFQRCSTNFNYRSLTMDEERCADSCAGKLIRTNHRLMGTYVQLMPKMVQRRMDEMESKMAAEAAKAAGAAGAVEGAGAGAAALPEGSSLADVPLPLVPAEAPPMISSGSSGLADFAPLPSAPEPSADIPSVPSPGPVLADASAAAEVPGMSALAFNPAGLEFPVDLVPAASVAIAAAPGPEGKMAAATSATPAAETMLTSSLTEAVNKAAFTTVAPLESPLLIREPLTTSVDVAAGAPAISPPIVPGNTTPATSVLSTFTPAAPTASLEVTSVSSIAPSAVVPQAPTASLVPLVPAPIVPPSVGLPEGSASSSSGSLCVEAGPSSQQ